MFPIIVSMLKNIPILEATNLITERLVKFWRLVKETPEPIQYYTYLGDDYSTIMNQFAVLDKWFESYRFTGVNQTNELFIYTFNVSFLKKEIDLLKLILILEKIAQRILTQHCVACGLNLPVNSLTAVTLKGDCLQFGFAKNNKGIEELTRIKQNMRKSYEKPVKPKVSTSIEVSWDDGTKILDPEDQEKVKK